MNHQAYPIHYGWPEAGPSSYPPPQIPPSPAARTPTPPLVEIGGLGVESDDSSTDDETGAVAGVDAEESDSDISDTSSSSSEGAPSLPSISSGSGDDYAPEDVVLSKPKRRGRASKARVKDKVAVPVKAPRRRNKKVDRPVNKASKAKGGKRTKGAGEGDDELEDGPDSVFE